MKIDLKKNQSNGTVTINVPVGTLNISPDDFPSAGTIDVVCDVRYDMDMIRIRGKVIFTAELECARCLELFEREITGNFSIIVKRLNKGETEPGITGDIVDEGDESLVYIAHDADTIDITEFVHDAVLLSLPLKPICRPDCKGLCPVCGNNRNEKDCDCKSRGTDPRWSALSGMFPKKTNTDNHK